MSGSNDYSTAEGSGVVSNLDNPQQPSFGTGSGTGSGSGTGKSVLDALSGLLPLFGPAGSVASMIYNFGSALWSNSESKKAAELQHERNIADWRMKNEYDSPAAQMARFRAAGLNPNLIYGQQSVSGATGSNASHPGSSVASPDMSGYNLSVQASLDRKMKEAQIENLRAQSDDLRASARERDQNSGLIGERILSEQSDRILRSNLNSAQVDEIRSNIKLIDSQTSLNNEQLREMKEMFSENQRKLQEEINLIISQQRMTSAQASLFREQASKLIQETKELCETWIDRKAVISDQAMMSARANVLDFNEYVISQAEQEARKYQAEWDRQHPKNANFRRIVTQYVNLNFGGSATTSISKVLKK